MRVLIAGCGDVGSLLAATLLTDGHEVHGLKRDVSSLPRGVLSCPPASTSLDANCGQSRTSMVLSTFDPRGWNGAMAWRAMLKRPR